MTKLLSFALAASLSPCAIAACGGNTAAVLQSGPDSGAGVSDAGPAQGLDGAPGETDSGHPASDSGAPPPSDAGGDGGDASACGDPSAWTIPLGAYPSDNCSQDSDCVGVFMGGDACEGVGGNTPCPNHAILQSSYGAYTGQYDAINQACHAACGTGSAFCASLRVYCDPNPTGIVSFCAVCTPLADGGCGRDGGE